MARSKPAILILGGRGMLGTDLRAVFPERSILAPTSAELDIRDAAALLEATAGADVVINAAAYTAVDDAETHEEEARAINAVGAENAARAAAESGAAFVQLSTDYVFDGTAIEPYREDTPRAPMSAYGRTKAEAEERVLAAHPSPYIVRTAWLYGAAGRNFPRTMLSLAAERDTVSVVTDQVGQPTWSADLAQLISTLLDVRPEPGIYHGTNSGKTTWFGFARAVFERAGLDPERIEPIDSSELTRPAPRPAYSVLGHGAWTLAALDTPRPWEDALDRAFADGVFDAELERIRS